MHAYVIDFWTHSIKRQLLPLFSINVTDMDKKLTRKRKKGAKEDRK